MRHLIDNILSLSPQNVAMEVIILSVFLWFLVWVVVIVDLLASQRSRLSKVFWMGLASVPILGGIFYAGSNLMSADWSAAFFWRRAVKPQGRRTDK